MQGRKAACKKFIEAINSLREIAESIRVNQLTKEKCSDWRRGPPQALVLRGERRTNQERWVEKENIKESAAQTKKQEPCKEVLHKGYGRIQPKKNPTGFRD